MGIVCTHNRCLSSHWFSPLSILIASGIKQQTLLRTITFTADGQFKMILFCPDEGLLKCLCLIFPGKTWKKNQERTKENMSVMWRYTIVPVVSISDYFCWESSPHLRRNCTVLPMCQLDRGKATALLECR